MRTLEYYYKELIESPDKWNYYEYPSFSYEEFQNGMCETFITNYLGKGSKTELPVFKYLNAITDEKRIRHIVSCFFLGMILYHKIPKFKKYIKEYLTKFPRCEDNKESDEQRFAYLWMLICLFHDNGYVVEHQKKTVTQSEIEDYLNKFPKNDGFVPSLYSKKLLQHYNDYIECKKSHQDHGIICGIEIYSDLCELREKKKNEPKHYWGKDLLKDFAIVSWIIACHNIFFIDENDINLKCYICKNLKVLIGKDNDSYPITLKKHPIFLLFCLVDSIEPIKVLEDQNTLNDIDCDIENLRFDFGKLCSAKGIEYEHKLLNLKKWLTNVTIEEDTGKRIVHIELNCK